MPGKETDRSSGHRRKWQQLSRRLMLAPLPLAVALFGGVHAAPQATISLVCAALAIVAALSVGPRTLPSKLELGVGLAALILTTHSMLFLIPVPLEWREWAQPGVAQPVNTLLGLLGADHHPLALDPHAAARAYGIGAATLAVFLTVLVAGRDRRQILRIASSIVITAAVLALLAAAQRVTGAENIWWASDYPLFAREPFFGTFVNGNHAGVLLSAAVPLGVALALRRHASAPIWWAATALICVATWFTGSRGAVLQTIAGVLTMGLLLAPTAARRTGAAITAATMVAVGIAGPTQLMRRASELLPGTVRDDPFAGRPQMWWETAQLIWRSPWLGVGAGGFEDGFKLTKESPVYNVTSHAHNEVLQSLAEWGLPLGALAIAIALVPWLPAVVRATTLKKGRRRTLTAAYLGASSALGLNVLVDFPLRLESLSVLGALLGASLLTMQGRRSPDQNPRNVVLWRVALFWAALGGIAPTVAWVGDLHSPAHPWADNGAAIAAADEAWEAHKAGDQDAAARALEISRVALIRRPLDHLLIGRHARVLHATGRTDEAVALLQAAATSYPTYPWHHIGLARLRRVAGDHPGARAAWRSALTLDLPKTGARTDWVAEALRPDPSPADAAAATLPDRTDRLWEAGVVLADLGEHVAAEQAFARAYARAPSAGFAYAQYLMQQRRYPEGWEVAQHVPPESCGMRRVRGELLHRLERDAEALKEWGHARRLCGQTDPRTRYGEGRTRLALGLADGAPFAEEELAQFPHRDGLRRTLAWHYTEYRAYDQAIPHFEQLLLHGRATPEEADTLVRLYAGLPPR